MAISSSLPPIRACLFDMDGLLIDSEDLYTICTNEVLREYGRPDLPWSIKAQLQGRPRPEAQRIFHAWAQLPLTPTEFDDKQSQLQRKYFPRIYLALATSSHTGNFHLKTAHLSSLFSIFAPLHRVLGDDPRIAPGRGKPAPDIYLLALETINASLREKGERELRPDECLVFEDSVPGVEAGRRAGMQVIWCPHPELLEEYRGREKDVLAGLTGEHKGDEGVGCAEVSEGKIKSGQPGNVDDGWARLLETLENFPYETYGIKIL
ncbi:HAD-like protein [Glonium stellatum]|uniref:HAD-like protein n=1 Tax=Glonium stellatum TaxID=574774 RepID=A0A8E2F4Y6_9PEZI|nr:HAD-like protein [Glonium stellatum]